ncbi:MAG TPA: sulfotransferase [Rhodanobacteraceae bacterium]|nr:sulfotransferase [Rhodanobacteraceae bacterium]
MKIDRPIFVVGVGRSGSTIFHQMLSEHPQLAWLSELCDRFPSHPGFNRALLGLVDWPLLGDVLKRRFEAVECYAFWEHHSRGFRQPCRDLLASDVTEASRRRLLTAMLRLPTGRRSRMLYKITGWPRIGFLQELFPDARFIHVCRDGRAVANSLLAVDFWRGWHGPAQWRWGELNASDQAEWERHGQSFVALAGIQWKLLMDATAEAAAHIPPGRFMEIRYEDFVADPVANFRKVATFCELDWSRRFENAIASYSLETTNDKWREDLTAGQQAILQAVLAESLARYGYA